MLKSNGFEEADDENWPPNTPGYRLKELLIIRNLKSTQDVYEKFNDLKSGYLKVQADFWQRAYESGRLTIDKLPKEVLPVIKPRLKGASAVGVLDEKIISFSKWSTA